MQEENRFNVDSPTVGVPVSYVPTAAAESKVTYSQVKFEDNSVNIWERLSDQLPEFWKQVQDLKKQKSELDYKVVQEKYRIHTFDAQQADMEQRKIDKAKAEKKATDRFTESQALKLTQINATIRDTTVREAAEEARLAELKIKGDHLSNEAGLRNWGRKFGAEYSLSLRGEDDLKKYTKRMKSLRQKMIDEAKAGNAFGGDTNIAEESYIALERELLASRDRLLSIQAIEDENEKKRLLAEERAKLANIANSTNFIFMHNINTNGYVDTAGGF